ncbi:MAG: tRNA uracil 4-sulfurtransferase ThiI [Candidatus Ventricola sp.]|nr:tRNA uracil 4-sulfurtransferase ThiI [Candidatus Ventricola sp.]MDY4542251.1 tRNA uracil 4-sulfurtransferase ThiI [Candidatus Ventricola sp.]MDY4855605.1 tRNA uracil 4-sulfurtransferase ThiI [Candidatus Ventricola sp.]
MREVLLVRYGEVFLKGQNRPFFLRKLVDHVKAAVQEVHGHVWLSEGRIYVSDYTDQDEAIRRVSRVFGVHSVSPAIEMEKDSFEAICAQAARMMEKKTGTFKVLAKRSDKQYPMDSPTIMREAGGYILDHVPQLSVDVNNPDHEITIEIRKLAYLSVDRTMAVSGMPMGTNGKACLLLSGGIDSPVAGFMIAKRGVELCCVHYHSFPYTSERAKEKVLELARILSEYCGKMRVYIVPFTEIQMQIHEKCPENFTTLIMRRYMMRIAEILARKDGAQALITGESIGQVASQTMEALGCTDEVVSMPVFRPCVGMDKSEIIERAEKIGTMETSSLPYEDCCTVFTPKHPATHPRKELVRRAEEKLDSQALIDAAIEGTEIVEVG